MVVARLYSTFFVSAQVAIVETPDPFKAMARSAHLTKGSRWVVFAVLLLVYGLRLVAPLLGASLGLEVVHAELGTWVALVLVAVFDLLLSVLLAVAAAVVYAELRGARESTPVAELLEVFD